MARRTDPPASGSEPSEPEEQSEAWRLLELGIDPFAPEPDPPAPGSPAGPAAGPGGAVGGADGGAAGGDAASEEQSDAWRLLELGIDPFAPEPDPADPPPTSGAASGSTTTGGPRPATDQVGSAEAAAGGADSQTVDSVHLDPADDPPVADTPLWLSHHWPDDYDRCAVVGGLHICRRCLVLYPLALVAGIAVSIGSWWDHAWDPWVLWLAPLPGVVEFVLDNLRLITYRPRRQMVLSAGGAVAAGVGYVRYLDNSTDTLAWSVLAVYTAVTLSGAIVGGLMRQRTRSASTRESP